jgi:hypothetical protein
VNNKRASFWKIFVFTAPEKKWTPDGDVQALCHGCDPTAMLKYTSGSGVGDVSGSPGHRCGISEKDRFGKTGRICPCVTDQ